MRYRVYDKKDKQFYEVKPNRNRSEVMTDTVGFIDGKFMSTNKTYPFLAAEINTGITDINNREIYVGDIIKIQGEKMNILYVVDSLEQFYCDLQYFDDIKTLKILGNRHENGDLIKWLKILRPNF